MINMIVLLCTFISLTTGKAYVRKFVTLVPDRRDSESKFSNGRWLWLKMETEEWRATTAAVKLMANTIQCGLEHERTNIDSDLTQQVSSTRLGRVQLTEATTTQLWMVNLEQLAARTTANDAGQFCTQSTTDDAGQCKIWKPARLLMMLDDHHPGHWRRSRGKPPPTSTWKERLTD